MRQQGKVRFFGVTTHTNQAEVVNAVASDPDHFFDTVLVGYNFKSAPELKQAIARAAQAGIGVVAMKTQAGGYQTAALGAVSPHQAALKWVLQDTNVTAAIPGMKDLAHLKEDIAVMGLALTRRDEQILKRYGQAISPYYCQLCGRCEGLCSRGVAISDINRCLMYAEAYGSLDLARGYLSGNPHPGLLEGLPGLFGMYGLLRERDQYSGQAGAGQAAFGLVPETKELITGP